MPVNKYNYIAVIKARYNGATLKDAGAEIGVTAERAREILGKSVRAACGWKSWQQGKPDTGTGSELLKSALEFYQSENPKLSHLAKDRLLASGYETVEKIRSAFSVDRKKFKAASGISWGELDEIKQWLEGDPRDSDLNKP